MEDRNIKKAVQTYYAEIATRGTSCCSNASGCCTTGDLIQVGDGSAIGEADLGLGCGMPTLHARIKPGDIVLDLGSGAGVDVFRAAGIVGETGFVIGVDMTPEMIARAVQNATNGGYTNVEFRLGEIEMLPVNNDSVDVVLSNCVINLVPDKRQAFREIYRVLRPGGRFSISDMVTYGEMSEEILQDLSLWAGCIAGAIDREAYLEIIRECGFDRVDILQEIKYNPLGSSEGNHEYGVISITIQAVKPI